MNLKGRGAAFLGFAALVGFFCLRSLAIRRWLGTSYWRWYIANGALIGLITPIVFKAWGDLADKHTGLLSPHPLVYLGSCVQVIGLPLYSLGTQIKDNQGRASWFDHLFTLVGVFVLLASILVWFVVVVPVQYIVTLFVARPFVSC